MSSYDSVLGVIADMKEKCTTSQGEGWNKAFDVVFNETKSKCRELVLAYREESPDIAQHIENVSNQLLSNIVRVKNDHDTENFKNSVRRDLLKDIAIEVELLRDGDEKSESKKKLEKKEELEK